MLRKIWWESFYLRPSTIYPKTPPSHKPKLMSMRCGGEWEKNNLAALDNELEFKSPLFLTKKYKNTMLKHGLFILPGGEWEKIFSPGLSFK